MPPVRVAAVLSLVAVLGACSSAREDCLEEAGRELRLIEALIAETELNIERGYRIEREADTRVGLTLCLDGSALPICTRNQAAVRERPVPINRVEERNRLATLKERRDELRAPTERAMALCGTSDSRRRIDLEALPL